ncbi:MAG: hypothetical protein Q4Q19_00595 [Methanobrevibacter sp.]|nr:hypothetical protein [Methanobrevibacter sp.]
MKVVMCQNCGAKYQLDDADDINAFECSVCAGILEEVESFPDNHESDYGYDYDTYELDPNSVLVFCKDCGLKYQLDSEDDVSEFECTSCGGPLDYVTDDTRIIRESEELAYDNGYQAEEVEEVPMESYFEDSDDDIIPIHADESYVEVDSGSDDDIIPVHAEGSDLVDDLSYVDEAAAVESGLDEIIPIHAEDNAESSYDMDTYREDSYIEDVPNDDSYIDDFDTGDSYIENEPYSETYPEVDYEIDAGDIIPMSDGYYIDDFSANYQTADDNFEGIDEIIPIHAENRRRERTSPNVSAGFQFNSFNDNPQVIDEEPNIVDVSNMPEGSAPVQTLTRKTLSKEDEEKYEKGKNQLVFDSTEEYEAYKVARLNYYNALMDILKEEYLNGLEGQFSNRSIRNLIKKGENLKNDDSRSLVSPEMVQTMAMPNRNYEPKKSASGDILIIAGLFLTIVGLAYYLTINSLIYILAIVAAGILLLIIGLYLRYSYKSYVARGRIIREKLLTLPPIFYVFYGVQPPGSKDAINHVVVGPTGIFTIISKRYDPTEYKNKIRSDNETDSMVNDSASIQDYMDKKNTLELQDGYDDHQTRFQFGNEEIHFVHNSKVKRKALELNEDLAIFLDRNGMSGIYIEPLLGFINNDLAILNVILTNEDLFMDELFHKMIYGQRRLDEQTIEKIALLLSHYSANCSD